MNNLFILIDEIMPKCIWKFWFGIRRIKMNIYFLTSKLTYLSQNIAKEKWKKIIKGMRGKCCGMHHVFLSVWWANYCESNYENKIIYKEVAPK